MRTSPETLAAQLVDRLQKAYAENLVSVVLYGSAAAGEYQPGISDINVLCVCSEIPPRGLAVEETIQWWRQHAHSGLILMTEREVAASSNSFAIELTDIQRSHRLLYGKDVVSALVICQSALRAQVERELRAKLLSLRQKALGMLSDTALLRRLLLDSTSTFCVLFRHALTLHGVETPVTRRAVADRAREHFQIDTAALEGLLDVREGRIKPRAADPSALLGPYLESIAGVIARMQKAEA